MINRRGYWLRLLHGSVSYDHVTHSRSGPGPPTPNARGLDIGSHINAMRRLLAALVLAALLAAPAGAPERVIVAFGDSLTAGQGVPAHQPDIKCVGTCTGTDHTGARRKPPRVEAAFHGFV